MGREEETVAEWDDAAAATAAHAAATAAAAAAAAAEGAGGQVRSLLGFTTTKIHILTR